MNRPHTEHCVVVDYYYYCYCFVIVTVYMLEIETVARDIYDILQ